PAGYQIDSSQPQELLTSIPEAEWWAQRADNLTDKITIGESRKEKADALYSELKMLLTHQRAELLRILDSADSIDDPLQGALALQVPVGKPDQKLLKIAAQMAQSGGYILESPETVIELYDSVNTLYWARVRLLSQVSFELWLKVTGTYSYGVQELKGELEQIRLRFELSQLKIYELTKELSLHVTQVPLVVLGRIFNLSLEILLLLWWRRWAKAGLPKLVSKLMDVRPRRIITLRLARFIWYVDSVRAPLEWMFLTFAIFSTLDVRGFGISIFYEFGTIVFKWIFLGWLAVATGNAIADRRTMRSGAAAAGLRIRSIHLFAFWLVLLGLARNLARNYTGDATLTEWVYTLFLLLLILVGLVLLSWWRPEVQRQLKEEVQKPKWVTGVLASEKGFMSYRWALLGLFYLIVLKIQRRIVSTVNGLESGRRFLANFLYRETVRQSGPIGHEEGRPASEQLRESLIEGTGENYDKYARQELKDLVQLVEQGAGGTIAIVGERGIGKSLFVKRAMEKSKHSFLIVECPVGEYFEGYRRVLIESLGLSETQASIEAINIKIEELGIKVVVIDNVHRLARPAMGGQVELSKLSNFIYQLGSNIFVIALIDKFAWQYLSRVRAKRLILEQVVKLPPWTVEQLADLIENKTQAAGIEPNYSRFILPPLFDEAELTTMDERRRYGFCRILWSASDGNPEISLRLYVKSLVVHDDGEIFIKMPIPPNIEQLDAIGSEQLLVLRVIAQCGYATPEEVQECLALPLDSVQEIFRVMKWRGWIESVNGYFRIKWTWYRAITRKLIRQNLLER
ncbi:MAG: ATP-binding protein, partial [Arenicellales bacterium]